jgi:Tol biopolymer transport system component
VRHLYRQPAAGATAVPVTHGEHDDIMPAWSPDGDTVLFVRAAEPGRRLEPGDVFGRFEAPADVWAMDLRSGREEKLIQRAYHPAFSPDGRRIAVDATWAGPSRLWIVDRNGRNPRQITTDTSEAVEHVRPRWSPDGERLVFQNIERTKFDVRIVRLRDGAMTWVTNDLFKDMCPVWTPDGRAIVFSSAYRAGGINLWRLPVSAEGAPLGPPVAVTTGAGQDVEPALAPDGVRIAFAVLRQNADVWRLPVDPATGRATGRPERLIGGTREESRGAWSPDGTRVAFNSDRSGDMNLWIHSLEDGAERRLTHGPGGDYQANWSPDGRTLVFFSGRSGNVDLWTVDVERGTLLPLTGGASLDVNPFYSPDGARIAFHSDRDGRLEVWVMNADGTEPRQLTRVGTGGHFLRWTPDGSHVFFYSPGLKRVMRVPALGGDPEPLPEVRGGAHLSLSPDAGRIMDVVAHKVLWVSPLGGGPPETVFEFPEPEARIDYPSWSRDGRWVLFDRFQPQGGDIWVGEPG